MSVSCITAVSASDGAETALPLGQEYTATQDTYIDESHPDSVYGVKNKLLLSGTENEKKNIYIAFRVRDEIGEYDRVLLKMTPDSAELTAAPETDGGAADENTNKENTEKSEETVPTVSILQSSVQEWRQTSLSWANAHKSATKISDEPITAGEEMSVDVSKYVKASRDGKGYIGFVLTAANAQTRAEFPATESLKAAAPKLVIEKDALMPDEDEKGAESEKESLVWKKVNTKYPTIPEMPILSEDFDIDEYTTTRYKPWMLNFHLTSPQQIKNGYYGGDAGQMGWTLAIAPTYPDLMILGTDTESVWRSENGGVSWQPSNTGLDAIGTTALAFDPEDENFVLVLANSGGSKDTKYCGIYKSEDAGKTWRFITHMTNGRNHNRKGFAFGPRDSKGTRRIYLSSNDKTGVFASDDEGETWKNIGDFAGHETKGVWTVDNKVIVVTYDTGIYISEDKGETWTLGNGNLPISGDGTEATTNSIVVNPDNHDHWIVIYNKCLYTSLDAGKTWEFTCDNSQFSRVSPQFMEFSAPDKDGHRILYCSIGTIQRNMRYSNDYGKTFNTPIHHNEDAYLVDNWGWGCEPMAVHPTDPYTAYIILDGEPYVTRDGGKNLHPSSSGYSGNRASRFIFRPDGKEFFISFIDRGFTHSMFSGRGEKYPMVDSYPIEDRFWIRQNGSKTTNGIDVNWDNPKEVWACIGGWSNSNLMLSEDGGRTFKKVLEKVANVFIHPQDPDTIYASNNVSHDHGKTWEKLDYEVRAVSPVNGDIVYGRTENATYRSRDGGKTWEGIAVKYSQKFTCDIEDEDKVYIGTNVGGFVVDGSQILYKTSDTPGIGTVYQIAQDPHNPKHLVTAGNDQGSYAVASGVWESYDGGETWKHIEGLGGTADVWTVQFHPTEQQVYMGTSNGTWVYECDKYYDMSKNVYTDVPEGYYAKDKIEYLYNNGISYQFHDGKFRPDEGMRRERFADMLRIALDLRQSRYEQSFKDISKFDVNYINVQALYENGFIEVPSDGLFRPKEDITYDEVAKMLYAGVRKMHIPAQGSIADMKNYVDDTVAVDVKYAVYQLKLLGIIDGTVKFSSGKAATNTDIAVMFYNFLQLLH